MARRALKRGAGFARTAVGFALAAVVGTWLVSHGSRSGWWSIDLALAVLPVCLALALIAIGVGLFSRFRRRDGQILAVTAVLLGLGVAGFLIGENLSWRSHPAIVDVTTNVDDPPAFTATRIRTDLLADVPVLNRPGYAELPPVERWKAVHADAYPDLSSVAVPGSPAQVVAKAGQAAKRRGWSVVEANPVAGTLELSTRSRFLGFHDDIALRARSGPSGTVVDLRSIAREGASDHGRGAKHIRKIRTDLSR